MVAWGPIATVASSLIGGGLSYLGQSSANRVSRDVAEAQMQFQERMSSTAHQREVADLKAAGLNPILSVRHGGASSPGGAMPNIRSTLEGAAEHLAKGVNSAVAAEKVGAEVDNLKSQNELLDAQKRNVNADTLAKAAMEGKTRAETLKIGADTNLSNEAYRKMRHEIINLAQAGRNLTVQEGILTSQDQSARAVALRDAVTEEMLKENPWLRKLEMGLELLGLGRRAGFQVPGRGR